MARDCDFYRDDATRKDSRERPVAQYLNEWHQRRCAISA